MKLLGLYIDGYGILNNFSLTEEDLSFSPCIVHGLNEAGKSTLLSFIRAVLFGFKAEGGVKEPVRGGKAGGYLLLEDEGVVYRVERYGKGNGKVVVELPDDERAGEELLRSRILRGMSPVLFKNVFAFGMDELRRLDDLEKDEVSAYIYGAGTGTGSQRLAAASVSLEKKAGELFKIRGRKTVLNKMLLELDGLDRKIRELEQQPMRYMTLRDELEELEQTRNSLRDSLANRQKRLRYLDNLLKARAPWNESQDCLNKQRSEEQILYFPEEGSERLSRLESKREEKIAEERTWVSKVKTIEEKLDAVKVDDNILSHTAIIKELEEEKPLYLEKKQNLLELQAKAAESEKNLQERIAALGQGWDESKVLGLDTSMIVRQQLNNYIDLFREQEHKTLFAANQVENRQKEMAERQAERDYIAQQIDDLSLQYEEDSVSDQERLELLEQVAPELEKMSHNRSLQELMYEKLEEINNRQKSVEKILHRQARNKKTIWPVFAAVLLGCLGIGIIYFNAILGLLILGGGIILAVLLNGILAGQIKERRSREEELRTELKELERTRSVTEEQLSRLSQEYAGSEANLSRLALTVAGRENIAREEIPSLRREILAKLENLRQLKEMKARLEKTEQTTARAKRDLQRSQEELEQQKESAKLLRKKWCQWLNQNKYPELNPAGAVDFLSLVERAADAVSRLRGEKKSLSQISNSVAEYERRVNELAISMGIKQVTREEIPGYVSSRTNYLSEQLKAQENQRRYKETLEETLEKTRLVGENLTAIEKEIQELLTLGGAFDEEDFRRRALTYREQREMARSLDVLHKQMLNIAGSATELRDLQEELSSTTRMDHELAKQDLESSVLRMEKDLTLLGDEVADRKQQMKVLESSEELARARQQRDMLLESLAAQAREWQVTVLCAALLEMAREKHERERQPAVLAQASRFIGSMTGERYARTLSPIGAAASLEVEEPDGRRVPAQRLSRGAAGQLYLAIRLALACHFSSVVTPMPVILDDIMVDSDSKRLRGAIKILDEIAWEHQVIFFTCHDYILEAAQEHLSRYSLVRLKDGIKV